MAKKDKKIKCWMCGRVYINEEGFLEHMEKAHKKELYGLPAKQVYFNWRNRYPLNKKTGTCVMTGRPTKFNLTTGRYDRLADDNAKEQYREMFRKRMIKVYGTDTLLTDPEHQKKMLANRKISGVYTWSDGKSKTTYTGSYERKFLEYLDNYLDWDNPNDIAAPAPMVFRYNDPDTGEERFHIPDFYISSINTIINIKAADNKFYRLRDIDTEKAIDKAIEKWNFNYVKLYDNEFKEFPDILARIEESKQKVIVESVSEFIIQEFLNEQESL